MAAAAPKIVGWALLKPLYPEIMQDPTLTLQQKVQKMWAATMALADGFCELKTAEHNLENLIIAQRVLLKKGKNISILWRAVLRQNHELQLERRDYENTPDYKEIRRSGNLIRILKNLNLWMLQRKEHFKNILVLNLMGTKFTKIPKEVANLLNLTELPTEITALQNLTVLHIDDNNLTSIPDLDALEKLKVLNFANNPQLKKLPESLAKIKNLRIFSLRGTQVKFRELSAALQAKVDIHPDNDEELPPPPILRRQDAAAS